MLARELSYTAMYIKRVNQSQCDDRARQLTSDLGGKGKEARLMCTSPCAHLATDVFLSGHQCAQGSSVQGFIPVQN